MEDGDKVTVIVPATHVAVKAVVRRHASRNGYEAWSARGYVRILWPSDEGTLWLCGHGDDVLAALLLARSAAR